MTKGITTQALIIKLIVTALLVTWKSSVGFTMDVNVVNIHSTQKKTIKAVHII